MANGIVAERAEEGIILLLGNASGVVGVAIGGATVSALIHVGILQIAAQPVHQRLQIGAGLVQIGGLHGEVGVADQLHVLGLVQGGGFGGIVCAIVKFLGLRGRLGRNHRVCGVMTACGTGRATAHQGQSQEQG
jgi:hypothetical protein